MATWWNPYYSVRKKFSIINTGLSKIPAGSQVFVSLDADVLIAQNKVRADFEDIEILFLDTEGITGRSGTGTAPIGESVIGSESSLFDLNWIQLGRQIDYNSNDGTMIVTFNIVQDIILKNDTNYYIYYCNGLLKNQSARPEYVSSIYSATSTPQDGGIMITRPTEDWDSGVSKIANARAAFSFYGTNARFVFQGRPDGGIVELNESETLNTYVDTYSNSSEDVIHEYNFGSLAKRIIRIRATGDKAPVSSNSIIELKQIDYSRYSQIELGSEEIYSISDSVKTMVGT